MSPFVRRGDIITIISCDYLNLSLADEHVDDVTIPTQVIEYNQNFLQPIRLKYSNQIMYIYAYVTKRTRKSNKISDCFQVEDKIFLYVSNR